MLLLPSEEFLPPRNHLSGIFQYHQALALQAAGVDVGVLSIRQAHSIPMIARAATLRLLGKTVANDLDRLSIPKMGRLLIEKLVRPRRFLAIDEVNGIPVVRIEGFFYVRPSPRTNHIGWIRAGVVAFDEYCKRFGRPDILHAHNSDPASLLAHRLSKQTGIPFVVTEHSSYFARGRVSRSLYPALRRSLDAASAIAVVSPPLAQVLATELRFRADRFRCIPNVLDDKVVNAPMSARSGGADAFSFFALGSLDAPKNHVLLLRAFQRAFRPGDSVKLRIGGEGELREELENLARELGISSQVQFLGALSRDGVIEQLDRCDALVLSSSYETFGVVVIEAMSRGKPVVSTRCGGPDDVVTTDDGILVTPDDVDALANGMVRLRRDRERYVANEIRNRTISRFGPERVAGQLKALYSEALVAHE